MSGISTTLWGRVGSTRHSSFSGMTIEEEIRSLNALLPEAVAQLPVLFAKSVANSCTSVLGEGPGEALVRRIGDHNLMIPAQAYGRIDTFLSTGSDMLKETIRQNFRDGVHRLYKIAMNVESKNHSSEMAGESPGGVAVRIRVPPSRRTRPGSI